MSDPGSPPLLKATGLAEANIPALPFELRIGEVAEGGQRGDKEEDEERNAGLAEVTVEAGGAAAALEA